MLAMSFIAKYRLLGIAASEPGLIIPLVPEVGKGHGSLGGDCKINAVSTYSVFLFSPLVAC
jgi:hypothetical protein